MNLAYNLLFLFLLLNYCQNQTVQVDPSSVPNSDPKKITGCTKYNKITQGSTITYQCTACDQNFASTWVLTLVTLQNGQKRCIKNIFWSQGCKSYGQALNMVYSQTFDPTFFLADESKDPNSYRKAFSCSQCLSNEYTQITYNVSEYFFGEGLDFQLRKENHPQYKAIPYEITSMKVIKCEKIKTLSTGCTLWSGNSFTYSLLGSKTSGNTKSYSLSDATSTTNKLGYDFQTDVAQKKTCVSCLAGSTPKYISSTKQYICSCNSPTYVSAIGYNADLCAKKVNLCSQYISLTECGKCWTGYGIYKSQCIQCSCLYGYQLNNEFCSFIGTIDVATCSEAQNKVPNCQTLSYSSSTYTCTKCIEGYYKSQDNKCLPNNCLTYLGNTQSCDTCKTGWRKPSGSQYCTECDCNAGYASSGSSCVRSLITVSKCSGLETEIPNCNIIDFTKNPRICSQCQSGFRWESGKCKDNHCQTTNCKDCKPGYIKPKGKSYCTDCDCQNGYVPDGQICVQGQVTVADCAGADKLIKNCKIFYFVDTVRTCKQCDSGYTLENNQCKKTPTCTGPSCNQCPTGYIKPAGSSTCSQCDCVNGYISSGSSCIQGYVTVSECSGANGLIAHCKVFYFSGTTRVCSTCDDGYRWEDNQCKNNNCKTSACNQCQTGYVKPIGGSYCSECDCINGYVADGLLCVPGDVTVSQCTGSEDFIPNCEVFYFQGTTRTCKGCVDGFRVENNQCKDNHCTTKDCSTCQTGYIKPSGGSYCTDCDCENGYVISNDACVLGEVEIASCSALSSLISECKKIDFTNEQPSCVQCNLGYRVQNNQCVNDHCKTYKTGTTQCQKCNKGYDFNDQNICVQITCDCTQGYLYDSNDKCTYVGVISRTNCLTGFTGFSGCSEITFESGQKKCTDCQTNYDLQAGSCYSDHCVKYGTGQNCEICETGYHIKSGKCTGCDCKLGYTLTAPNQCTFSPYIQTSSCPEASLLVPNCKILQIVGKKYSCAECILGYTKENGLCTQKVQYCNSYNIFSKCVSCKNLFLLTPQNSCIPEVFYCQSYSSQRKTCLRCIQGYVLTVSNNGVQSCIKAPQNCANVAGQSGTCSKCKSGYSLVNNVCTSILPPCGSNQYRNRQGICVVGTDQNCAQYDIDGLCSTCISNFKVNINTGKCQSVQIENYQKCSTDTTNYQFIQLEGSCIKIDINCDPSGFQPSGCYACKQGYYLYNSFCYKYNNNL